ncbi:hypothetical protein [Helicobacter cetorum]|uniref:Uncharacterized protein n=1 Tax=Helicobacter cetorum (strain ATCC BAA-429 / MIT 00-7128) TaxID=182217 RepID=I0ELN7_HELC0|nr:hypothetical protein [Helicobacter cetorum]AFI03856.1 hypothetical protein HCW_02875 [Helicobacter cetorum MIT 00-7128]
MTNKWFLKKNQNIKQRKIKIKRLLENSKKQEKIALVLRDLKDFLNDKALISAELDFIRTPY